jgi:hypothetical protein
VRTIEGRTLAIPGGVPGGHVTVYIDLATPIDIGPVEGGFRRVIPILGGRVKGEGFSGRVLESGADWQLIRPEGCIDLDARYVLEIDQG